ncbi:MAG: hypothetical protein H7A33_01210 [Deltaproteobacteria bacterium]|nr:hypothetical protein [Deltaproteobacteria bacterium]
MKRTTLLLEDQLYERVKKVAKENGTSLKTVINNLLRKGLSVKESTQSSKPFQMPLFKGSKPQIGFDPTDRDTWDILDS